MPFKTYSQVANRRRGRLLNFRNFSDPRSLLGPPLIDFFTPDFIFKFLTIIYLDINSRLQAFFIIAIK